MKLVNYAPSNYDQPSHNASNATRGEQGNYGYFVYPQPNNVQNSRPQNQYLEHQQPYIHYPYFQQQPPPPVNIQMVMLPPQSQVIISETAEGNRYPVTVQCKFCNNTARTSLDTAIGRDTIIAGCLIGLVCWPVFWLPCVMDECKDIIHLCGSCGKQIGKKRYSIC